MQFAHNVGYVLGIVIVTLSPFAFIYCIRFLAKKLHTFLIALKNLIKERNMTEEEKKEQRIIKTVFKYIMLFTLFYVFLFYILPLILLLGMLIIF